LLAVLRPGTSRLLLRIAIVRIFTCSDQSQANCIIWKDTQGEINKENKRLEGLTANLEKLKKIQGELANARKDAKTICNKIGGFNHVWLAVGSL
jgi:hypothetical protein